MAITAASIASRSNGGCACGAVRFVAEGEPYRVGLCHCFDCRKQHGAPFGAFAIFPADQVTFVGDEPGVFAFSRRCGMPNGRIMWILALLFMATNVVGVPAKAFSPVPPHDCIGCTLAYTSVKKLPKTGRTLSIAKFLAKRGKVVVATYDERARILTDTGQATLLSAETKARSLQGNLSDRMYSKLVAARAEDRIDVLVTPPIRLDYPRKEDLLLSVRARNVWESYLANARMTASRHMRAIIDAVGGRVLNVINESVVAEVSRDNLEKLMRDGRIARIDEYDRTARLVPMFEGMVDNNVWPYQNSTRRGENIVVGFLEESAPAPLLRPHLPGLPAGGVRCDPNCSEFDWHSVLVMSVVRRGAPPMIAYSARTVVSNLGLFTLVIDDDIDWLKDNWAPPVINVSVGPSAGCPVNASPGAVLFAKQMDVATKSYPYPLFVAAAGNGGECVRTIAYNGLIVGGTVHTDDTPVGATMWPSSDWQNQPTAAGDRQLPSVVAPACQKPFFFE